MLPVISQRFNLIETKKTNKFNCNNFFYLHSNLLPFTSFNCVIFAILFLVLFLNLVSFFFLENLFALEWIHKRVVYLRAKSGCCRNYQSDIVAQENKAGWRRWHDLILLVSCVVNRIWYHPMLCLAGIARPFSLARISTSTTTKLKRNISETSQSVYKLLLMLPHRSIQPGLKKQTNFVTIF